MGVAGTGALYMAIMAFVFCVIVMVLQEGTTSMSGLFAWCFHQSPEVSIEKVEDLDEDVTAEAELLDDPDTNVLPSNTPIIVRHLRKVYQARGNIAAKVAVKDVSFHVAPGEVFGYLGINGAGKTTSLSMLSGEFPPTSGNAWLAGMDMLTHRGEINRSMGYCPQFDALFPKMTGREHLVMYARIKGT